MINLGIEKHEGVAALPTFQVLFKVRRHEMPGHGRDGEVDPLRARREAVGEVVVFDPLGMSCVALMNGTRGVSEEREGGGRRQRTVLNWPPERIWVIDLEMEGFSATQRYLTMVRYSR